MVAQSPDFLSQIEPLWYALDGDARKRALAVATFVATYCGDNTKIVRLYRDLIADTTPPCRERTQALAILKSPLSLFFTESPKTALRIDPEIGRLCIALDYAAELRLWVVGREMVRELDGSGVVTRRELRQRVMACKVGCTTRHFDRLLQQGAGRFWILKGKQIYLRSIVKVAVTLVVEAEEKKIPLGYNRPGVRDSFVDVSGGLERWEAMLYMSWVANRAYTHPLTIARATESQLFNRHPNSIRRWEEKYLGGVLDKQTNFAQCTNKGIEDYFDYVPEHAQAYVARWRYFDVVCEEVRLRWQLPNSYIPKVDHSHAHRGQAGRVRRAVNAVIPAPEKRGGHFPVYLPSFKRLKRLYRSKRFREASWDEIVRPRYVYIGYHRRTKQQLYEITTENFGRTHPYERVGRCEERRYFERQRLKREAARQAKEA